MGKKNNGEARQTRQGVRDLSNIGSRTSRGRRYDEPPAEAFLGPGHGDDGEQEFAIQVMEENRADSRRRRQ